MRSFYIGAIAAAYGLITAVMSLPASANDSDRRNEVATRGAQVMPFKLSATTHVFSKTPDGALQQVLAKNPQDDEQIRLIRQHLKEIADRFGRGDFSGPAHIHGAQMPGLTELKTAKPGEIVLNYQELVDGAQIQYSTHNASLVVALHRWIDAQLSDHGPDAREGGGHHHDHPMN